jgi:FKBP-type peptidyl-prolyl cis-trans isomerase FklB
MRNKIVFLFATMIILSCSAQGGGPTSKSKLKIEDMTAEQKASYSYGVLVAENLKRGGIDSLDADVIAQAIKDIMVGNEPVLDYEKAQATWQEFATAAQQAQQAKEQAGSLVNKELGAKFMADNAKKEGVVTLPNGLQYKIIKEGNGPKPGINDKVNVHYHGTLIDGTVFDSSVERGEPITFGVTQVIKGWTEILQLMPTGSKWTVYIPENLAYGANPRPGGAIKPYMTLIFDIELLSVVK